MEDASYFEDYSEANTLFYFLINKTDNNKIAICVLRDSDNKFEGFDIYDAEDNHISESEVPTEFIQLAKDDAIKQPKTKYTPTMHKNESGELHREDGPAIEYPDGTKHWYLNGKLHREDGPAIEYADGSKKWALNDVYHREDGPAIEYPDGTKAWFLNGKELYPKQSVNDPKLRKNYPQLIQSMKDVGY